MGFSCKLFGHKWNGCTCERCGEIRDEEHDWDGCKCSRCGKSRNEEHNWNGCKCSRCGKVRDQNHNYVKGLSNNRFCEEVCKQCGKKKTNTHVSNSKKGSKCPICNRAILSDEDIREDDLNKAWEMANGTGRTGF